MKKKELSEFKNKALSEIRKKIADLEREKTQTVIELKMGKVKDVKLVSKNKKDIARLKTLERVKYLASILEKGVKNAAS